MAVTLRLPSADDLSEVVDSLLDAADACEKHAPTLAAKRRRLAESIGDALDLIPAPTTREDTD
ncbi:hypothetical protein [Streptomyces pini]|uniref:Uncharacterized protein n=1 Tax=Streptomyces pini TaxID=1520580 RepID=A0A1I4C1B8_9ACTN|nr:hypothetical protein [Streptomyces pini]SFK74735.1 hypothetical protein SAMN05192584_108214 [Streptomyces pini]